jgi:methylisocitrate lyase
MEELEDYKAFSEAVQVPILANITEFGNTPLFDVTELAASGVHIILYPLSAFRAMNKAAEEVYRELLTQGTQKGLLTKMQTREELYDYLGYHEFEKKLDSLFGSE